MSALERLEELSRGERPVDFGLLGTARMWWSGVDRMSEEDILATFAAHPFPLDEDRVSLQTPTCAAIVTPDGALVADSYQERIGRLWRVGDEIEVASEPVLHVAFDVDMNQDRRDLVHFRAEDHPDLSREAQEPLISQVNAFVEAQRQSGYLRLRAFVVRAFGDGEKCIALLSVFGLSNEQKRTASFHYAVVVAGSAVDGLLVNGRPLPADWTPRL